MNEGFKRTYSDVLTESVDESYKGQLKKALIMKSMNVVANGGSIKSLEIALQEVIEEFFPDKSWWEVTNCNIFMELLGDAKPREVCDMIVDQMKEDCCDDSSSPSFVNTREQSIVSGDPSMDHGYDLYESHEEEVVEEAVSNPERTISKVDKNLAKEVDNDLVRDLTLILENDGEVYRRSITPVINNLKKKKAKGQFDEKLAIQAFFHVVEGALKQSWFKHYYSYSIETVSVPERYAVAKELLDGFMEEIEWDDTHKNENLSISKIRNTLKESYDRCPVEDLPDDIWDKIGKYLTGDGDGDIFYSWKDAKRCVDAISKLDIKGLRTEIVREDEDGFNPDMVYVQIYLDESLTEAFDDMEPDVWDTEYEDVYTSAYPYTSRDGSHHDIVDKIKRRGYINATSNSDRMMPITNDVNNIYKMPKYNYSYSSAEKKRKKELSKV